MGSGQLAIPPIADLDKSVAKPLAIAYDEVIAEAGETCRSVIPIERDRVAGWSCGVMDDDRLPLSRNDRNIAREDRQRSDLGLTVNFRAHRGIHRRRPAITDEQDPCNGGHPAKKACPDRHSTTRRSHVGRSDF